MRDRGGLVGPRTGPLHRRGAPFEEGGPIAGLFRGGAIVDTAGGYAAPTLLPTGSDVATLEHKANFRPAGGRLVAEISAPRTGRSVAVTRG